MKLAFIVPRYGDEVVGGAEYAVRMLAERLVADPDRDVEIEVLTTCAVDARTWAGAYPEAEVDLRGVRVRRFTAAGRSPRFDDESAPLLARPESVGPADEARWLELQGPVSPGLVDAERASDADLVICSPYLFHPTVAGARVTADRMVLHPAAHDEAVLRLPMYRALFESATGLVFYTHAEQQLVLDRFAVAATPQIVLGLGCDPPPDPRTLPADPLDLGGRPYVLCLGRVEGSKGTDELARAFARYKEREPGPLALVFVGPVSNRPPAHPDIRVVGTVDDATKWAVLRDALALVSPSAHESFGIVLLEAWSSGIPVVVNAAGAATRELCRRSGGGLWFRDGAELGVVISRLAASAPLRAALARRGREFVDTHCAWPALLDRYEAFLRSRIAHRGSPA